MKDTAGPALNPMIKVINLISLLFSGVILSMKNVLLFQIPGTTIEILLLSVILSLVLIGIVGGAVMYSKRETKEEEKVLDTEAPISSDVIAQPNPVKVDTSFALSAKLDDSKTGGSKIASAEYTLDGTTWLPMAAADSSMDSVVEKNTAKVTAAKSGIYNLQVRGTDELGNKASEKELFLWFMIQTADS